MRLHSGYLGVGPKWFWLAKKLRQSNGAKDASMTKMEDDGYAIRAFCTTATVDQYGYGM